MPDPTQPGNGVNGGSGVLTGGFDPGSRDDIQVVQTIKKGDPASKAGVIQGSFDPGSRNDIQVVQTIRKDQQQQAEQSDTPETDKALADTFAKKTPDWPQEPPMWQKIYGMVKPYLQGKDPQQIDKDAAYYRQAYGGGVFPPGGWGAQNIGRGSWQDRSLAAIRSGDPVAAAKIAGEAANRWLGPPQHLGVLGGAKAAVKGTMEAATTPSEAGVKAGSGGFLPREDRSMDEVAQSIRQYGIDRGHDPGPIPKYKAVGSTMAYNFVVDAINFVNSPEGLTTIAATSGLGAVSPFLKRAVQLGFAGPMVTQAFSDVAHGRYADALENIAMATGLVKEPVIEGARDLAVAAENRKLAAPQFRFPGGQPGTQPPPGVGVPPVPEAAPAAPAAQPAPRPAVRPGMEPGPGVDYGKMEEPKVVISDVKPPDAPSPPAQAETHEQAVARFNEAEDRLSILKGEDHAVDVANSIYDQKLSPGESADMLESELERLRSENRVAYDHSLRTGQTIDEVLDRTGEAAAQTRRRLKLAEKEAQARLGAMDEDEESRLGGGTKGKGRGKKPKYDWSFEPERDEPATPPGETTTVTPKTPTPRSAQDVIDSIHRGLTGREPREMISDDAYDLSKIPASEIRWYHGNEPIPPTHSPIASSADGKLYATVPNQVAAKAVRRPIRGGAIHAQEPDEKTSAVPTEQGKPVEQPAAGQVEEGDPRDAPAEPVPTGKRPVAPTPPPTEAAPVGEPGKLVTLTREPYPGQKVVWSRKPNDLQTVVNYAPKTNMVTLINDKNVTTKVPWTDRIKEYAKEGKKAVDESPSPPATADEPDRGPVIAARPPEAERTLPVEDPARPRPLTTAEPSPERIAQVQMQNKIDGAYKHLYGQRAITKPEPGQGLSDRELVLGGKQAIANGVDPVAVAKSANIRPDLKYGVLRAHGEDLRGEAERLDEAARKSPTAENKKASENAFQEYSNWNGWTVEPNRIDAKAAFPDMEDPVKWDIKSFVDYREHFIRANGKDLPPQKFASARETVRQAQAKTDALYKELDERSKRLAEEGHTPVHQADTPEQLHDAVQKIMKDHFPCD